MMRPDVTSRDMATLRELIGDYSAFISMLDRGLAQRGIERGELSMMDHICYRVETGARYQRMLKKLSGVVTLLGENEVSGRQIATFEFNEYLRVQGWVVPYLELPAPKSGSPYSEGLEHAELVVVGSLEQFFQRHRNLSFSLKGMSKSINREAGLKENNFSVKFHEQQLGAVVRIEKQLAQK